MRKLKALIAGLTALCMCAVYMPLTETALPEISILSAHAEESGTCGENLTWTLNSAGTLTISGTGEMTNWTFTNPAPWYRNNITEGAKNVIIKNGITSIGDYAFLMNKNLSSIAIPNSVKYIGKAAFWYTGLTSVTIPNSVTIIGDDAFYQSTSLSSVTIPKSVTTIGNRAFSATKLTSVDIPESVTNIETKAFSECSKMTSINVSENNPAYVSENGVLFNKEKKQLIQYPIGNTNTEYKIPNGVTEINTEAFYKASKLISVTIPDSVINIHLWSFRECTNLTSVTIPYNTADIGYMAFFSCTSLSAIIIKNPDCKIFENPDTISDTAVIYGYPNSTAQAYAEKYDRKFVALEGEPEEPTTEASTEASTQPTTEKPTEPVTEAPTQPTTEKPTEPVTEAPTQPTTEEPTEPVKPSREKKFVEGADNWSFSNSKTNFGSNYFIEDSYYKKLLNGLNNIEKEKIYDAVRNKKWSGSCYGMATTSVLASNSILNPADYQKNANFLHDISAPPSDEVKSLINYYFMLQFTDNIQNQTRQAAYQSEEEKLKKLIACLEDDSPALLTYFGYFNSSKFNYGGHGVVAYGVEYGTYSKDGKAYNGKILTYDNNHIDYDEDYCLYFNTSDWSWVIPYYQLDSKKGSTLGFVSDDVNLLNAHGYLNGGTYQNSNLDYIAMLDADTMNGDYSIHKVNYSNGTWINAPTAEDDIKLFSSLSDAQETNNLCFALKDAESGYVMELKTPVSMNLSMNYENTLLNATASKGLNMCFSPEGCIFLEGEKTNYNMQVVLNESELVTDWYSFSISGGNADAVKLEKAKDGYILTSPDMKNIIAEAYNDENDAFVNFSTDADSVFLYEIDKNTIGVKVDSNGDGTYDKLIAQTPESITGDANLDGTVDILDVITINKAVLGKETLTRHQNEFSDVNQNGVPDSSDSLAVLKYIVGLTSSLK